MSKELSHSQGVTIHCPFEWTSLEIQKGQTKVNVKVVQADLENIPVRLQYANPKELSYSHDSLT